MDKKHILTKLQFFIHFLQGMETYEQNPLDFWIMLVIWWSQPREQEIKKQKKTWKTITLPETKSKRTWK